MGHDYDACLDLAKEAKILSALRHPNIITIHGFGTSNDSSPFIILERICHTLEEQCQIWKRKYNMVKMNRNQRCKLWNERLEVTKDLANVMTYLHGLNIVFRDMKPQNCGFDINGVFKLFDFGLATTLTSKKKIQRNQYQLTTNTGTRRYMAPEVYHGLPYGKPADVYSFALIIWEVFALKTPFKNETRESHVKKVYGTMQCRPKIKLHWPMMLQMLIRECWSADPKARPDFDHIELHLKQSCAKSGRVD